MNTLQRIWNSFADANARLWRRSKIAWLAGFVLLVCSCCTCYGTLNSLTPAGRANATATAIARDVQATARAIETENAQAIAQMTRAAASDTPRPPTQSAPKSATPHPLTSTPTAPDATPTIFYVVVTGVPTRTPLVQKGPPTVAIPPTTQLTSGQYVASTYHTAKNYYCVTDPAWKELEQAYLIWSNDPAFFEQRGLKLHQPC